MVYHFKKYLRCKIIFLFQISIQDISSKTGLQHNDIALTLMLLGFMGKNNNKFMLAVDWDKVEDHMKKAAMSLAKKSRYAILEAEKLHQKVGAA